MIADTEHGTFHIHFHYDYDANKQPTTTYCSIHAFECLKKPGESFCSVNQSVGVAKCHPTLDHFTYSTGRKVALARALDQVQPYAQSRTFRAAIWGAYHAKSR